MLDIDTLVAEAVYEPFLVTIGGTVYRLPHMATLPTGATLALAETVTGIDVLRVIAQDDAFVDACAALPLFAVEAIVAGWQKHSGISVGESQASSGS